MFVKPHLHHLPPIWMKYMGEADFVEPTRPQIMMLQTVWKEVLNDYVQSKTKSSTSTVFQFRFRSLTATERTLLETVVVHCPYLPEPRVILAATMEISETLRLQDADYTRQLLATQARTLLEEWGMLTIKSAGVHGMKEVLDLIELLEQ
jgi:FixJ family two-component response regulator